MPDLKPPEMPAAASAAQSPHGVYLGYCREEKLAYQIAADGSAVFHPRIAHSDGTALRWAVSRGLGTVYATTVVHRPAEAPLNVAIVALDEGFRMMSRVEEISPEAVKIGLRVKVTFRPRDKDEAPLPVFVPLEPAS
jgi:uncharacterized OB-fold protein